MPEEKIETITLPELRRINDTVHGLIKDELLKMGIEVKLGASQYSDSSTGCLKLEFNTVGGLTQEALLLENSWENLGFKDNPRGEFIDYNRKNYVVVGLRSRARKNPIIVRLVETNEEYRMSVEMVCQGLHNSNPDIWPAKPWSHFAKPDDAQWDVLKRQQDVVGQALKNEEERK